MKVEAISRYKKYAYLGSLSEDDFRDQVIRPLLLRLGYADGRDLCGPTEAGKDALFTEINKLGLVEYVAVQTKKGPLNLASKAAQNVVTAITQVQTALATTYVLTATRQKITPNRVVLCASGKINPSARQHISEALTTSNIQFLDADDLIPLIDQRLQEFWLGIDADLMPYFRAIKQLVIGKPSKGGTTHDTRNAPLLHGAATDDIFVPLNVFRRVLRVKKRRGQVEHEAELQQIPISALHNLSARRVLLLGSAGSGKSTALLRIAYVIADRGIIGTNDYRIPVLLRASEILRSDPPDLLGYCDSATRALSNSHKSCFTKADLDQGRVLVLIDSLDELPSNESRERVLRLITTAQVQYPLLQVIVSCRPYAFVSELPDLARYHAYTISPLNWKQAEHIVVSAQHGKRASPAAARDILRKLEHVHGIELNPLLVTVFAAVNEYARQDIPANITELFKKFTELMLGRWDEQKGLKHQYQAPLKDYLLRQVAFQMHQVRRTSMSRAEVERIIADHMRDLGHEPDTTALTRELFERSSLFRLLDDSVEFRHHLIQEFFAGRCISSLEQATSFVCDEWWRRALVFYFGENPDQIAALRNIMASLSLKSPPELFGAASTLGLALQACYLSPVSEKLEAWKWVVDTLGTTQAATVEAYDPEGKRPALTYLGSYFFARDSVALSNLSANLSTLLGWCQSEASVDPAHADTRRFWTLIGLVESGELRQAETFLSQTSLTSPQQLAALHLGCALANVIRPLDDTEKEAAKRICKSLDEKIAPVREQVFKEWGSDLLELRQGRVRAIDTDME